MICKISSQPPVWLIFYRPECHVDWKRDLVDWLEIFCWNWVYLSNKSDKCRKDWFPVGIWYFTDRSVKYTPSFPELRNYWSFWLEIFTSDSSWPSKTMCKISSQSVTWFLFYRPVSILPKMLTFWTTTCPISLKFWQQASIINTYHWSKFQVYTIFQSWDMKIQA